LELNNKDMQQLNEDEAKPPALKVTKGFGKNTKISGQNTCGKTNWNSTKL